MRFARLDERLADERQPFDPIRIARLLQALQDRCLPPARSHDQLSATLIRHSMRSTELVEHASAPDTVPGLQRSSRIVDARVNDLAVVRAGAHAGAGLALQDTHAVSALGDSSGGREADHAGADNDDVNLFHEFGESKWLGYDLRTACARPAGSRVHVPHSVCCGSSTGALVKISRVFVLGASGQLGSAVLRTFADR